MRFRLAPRSKTLNDLELLQWMTVLMGVFASAVVLSTEFMNSTVPCKLTSSSIDTASRSVHFSACTDHAASEWVSVSCQSNCVCHATECRRRRERTELTIRDRLDAAFAWLRSCYSGWSYIRRRGCLRQLPCWYDACVTGVCHGDVILSNTVGGGQRTWRSGAVTSQGTCWAEMNRKLFTASLSLPAVRSRRLTTCCIWP